MHRFFILAAAAVVLSAIPAHSEPLFVRIQASATGGDGDKSSSANPHLWTSNVISGQAFADLNGSSSYLEANALDPCTDNNDPWNLCDYLAVGWGPPGALARAEANGGTGALKVRAIAQEEGDTYARAEARLSDFVDFLGGSPTIEVFLDLQRFSGDVAFGFDLWQTFGDDLYDYFSFHADEDGYVTTVMGETVDFGSTVPSTYSYVVTNALIGFLGFNAGMTALAHEGIVRADNSAYLKIAQPYTSQNGFSYPGPQQGPVTTPVPEPGAALLLMSGAALLGAIRRRQRGPSTFSDY